MPELCMLKFERCKPFLQIILYHATGLFFFCLHIDKNLVRSAFNAHIYPLNQLGLLKKESLFNGVPIAPFHDKLLGSEVRLTTAKAYPYEVVLCSLDAALACKYLDTWHSIKKNRRIFLPANIA